MITFLTRLRNILWPPMSNLLGPDILCEIVIHVMPDFSRKVYVSKMAAPVPVLARVVESVIRTGIDIGNQHGITVQLGGPNAPESCTTTVNPSTHA